MKQMMTRWLPRRGPKAERPPRPNALVIEPDKSFGLEYVEEPKGRRWLYGGQWVHLMVRRNDQLTALGLPMKLGTLPEKLYRALFWKEAEILFSLQSTLLEKLHLVGIYVLIGILLFFIYLMYDSL